MTLDRWINNFQIISQKKIVSFSKNQIFCQVLFRNVPVASFYDKEILSQKIAAVHLVASGLATQKDAAEVVGLHRNTVSKAVKINRLMGIHGVIRDDRGPKKPHHYTLERQAYIINLLKKHPDWNDEKIANNAAKGLKTRVSRQAVARIRIELPHGRKQKPTNRKRNKGNKNVTIDKDYAKIIENNKILNKKKSKTIYL